jgi:hypothetical protein
MGKDTYYFKHNTHSRHEPKIEAMLNKHGMVGYGRYWVIMEMLREDETNKLENKKYIWASMSLQMKCPEKEIRDFIKECIEEHELFIQEDGFFYSPDLLEKMAKLNEIRQKRKLAAYAGHYKQGHNVTQDGIEP